MRNDRIVISIPMPFLSMDWCIGLHFVLLRNVILQRYYYDVTVKTFRFGNARMTAWNKGELANQNAAYKIIALECEKVGCYYFFISTQKSYSCDNDVKIQESITNWRHNHRPEISKDLLICWITTLFRTT